ncbi:MAG: hypothetical protein GKR90_02125 [Pseudomonadales bacterium]|nr:hypothetical protein [Pseudomonadales bacterium]
MQPQLKYFLAGLAGLVLLIGAGVAWLGPGLVQLAFFAEGRDEPYLVMDFYDGRKSYPQVLDQGEEAWGGKRMGGYQLAYLVEGQVADEWPALELIHFAEANSVVQFVTSGVYLDYQNAEENFEDIKLGSRELVVGETRKTIVLWMVEEVGEIARGIAAIKADLPPEVHIQWQGTVDGVQHETNWHHGIMLGFDSYDDAMTYLRRPETTLQRQMVRSRVQSVLLAVYESVE